MSPLAQSAFFLPPAALQRSEAAMLPSGSYAGFRWCCGLGFVKSDSGRTVCGQAAPSLIHCVSSAFCSDERCFLGGIWSLSAWLLMARISRLFSGCPEQWPRFSTAAGNETVAIVDAQATLCVGVSRVTVVAIVDQQRTDFLLKELDTAAGSLGASAARQVNSAGRFPAAKRRNDGDKFG